MNDIAFALCEVSLACLAVPRRALQRAEGVILRARRRLIGPLFVALAALMFATGCHGAERATRTALDVAAHAVVAADTLVADRYATASHDALDASASLADYHTRMSRWDRAEEALRATRAALYSAEYAVDATGAEGVAGILACVRASMATLLEALAALDVPIPEALTRAVETLESFVGECRP